MEREKMIHITELKEEPYKALAEDLENPDIWAVAERLWNKYWGCR